MIIALSSALLQLRQFIRQVDWEPERFRDFYSECADRIGWGTDQIMVPGHTTELLLWQHTTEIAVLERSSYRGWQKYFPARELFGLGLNEGVLNKIFYNTPMSILEKLGGK